MGDQFENRDDRHITIRLATAADALTLARVRYVFRSSIDPACETEEEFVERCSLWMESALREDPLWRCWIAERDHLAVGNVWVQLIEKIPNPVVEPEHYAYLTNFYVCEEARSKGIGSMLLTTALDWIRSQDVEAVILWPTEQSRSLYLRHGFAVRADFLELPLAEIEGSI